MDERLEKALEFSNYMVTLNNQRRGLKEKFLNDCVFYQGGGSFTITKELINFCKLLIDQGNDEEVILIDDNDLPVEITDMKDFFLKITNIYFSATNSYFSEYQKLKSNRTIEKMML
jgi:hypothetical protein